MERTKCLVTVLVPVQSTEPEVDGWVVVADRLEVALKDRNVNRIEPDDGHVKTYVRLSEVVAKEVFPSVGSEHCLHPIKLPEQGVHVGIEGILRTRKATLVSAFVEDIMHRIIQFVDLLAKGLGIQPATRSVDFAQVLGDEVFESGGEHTHDVGAFIVDDSLRLLVPQDRH